MNIISLKDVDYAETLELQRREFAVRVEARRNGQPLPEDIVIIAEHRPVYTLGRHADEANLLIPEHVLEIKGAKVYRIDRGGDITYHGPGQLTVYPILDLQRLGFGVKSYVDRLEEVAIRTVEEFGITGERVDGATGVWIDVGTPRERKISAIGIRCSRHVSMHGLALNVGPDLSGFNAINPCGFTDRPVTSISRELSTSISTAEVLPRLIHHLTTILKY